MTSSPESPHGSSQDASSSSASPKKANSPSSQEPRWMALVLILGAALMAFVLWNANQEKRAQRRKRARQLKASMLSPTPRIKMLPPRTIPLRPARRRMVAPGKRQPTPRKSTSSPTSRPTSRPAKRPLRIRYKPSELFYPIPFGLALKARDAYYKQEFANAKKLKHGVHEKMFVKLLHKEMAYEAQTSTMRAGYLRLATMRYLRYRGKDRYHKMGFLMLSRFEEQLDQYLQQKAPIDTVPNDGKYAALATKLARYGGHYPLLLRNVGVKAGQTALTPKQRFWLRTLYISRWYRTAIGYYPLPVLMGKTLYSDYMKARFLFTRHAKKRIFYARELKRLNPKLPHHRVLGWLYVQIKRPVIAIVALRAALKQDPKDQIAQRLLDKLLKSPS